MIILNWDNILGSIISGLCVGFAIIAANSSITASQNKREFHSNLALVIIELYLNYSKLPDCKIDPFLPCKPMIFELSSWESLKVKLISQLKKSEFLRIEVLYYNLKSNNETNWPKDISDCMYIKFLITNELDELLAISKYDFNQFDQMIRKDEARKPDIQNVKSLLKQLHKSMKQTIKSRKIHPVSYIREHVFHKKQL